MKKCNESRHYKTILVGNDQFIRCFEAESLNADDVSIFTKEISKRSKRRTRSLRLYEFSLLCFSTK